MTRPVLVLDFGGQYKQLIASLIRQKGVYAEIIDGAKSASEIKEMHPLALVLTGGPRSVYESGSPLCDPLIFELGVPVLGICYGMQLMCHTLKGRVSPADSGGEYGKTATRIDNTCKLFEGLGGSIVSLMSHSDSVSELPQGFVNTARTSHCKNAAAANEQRGLYCVQFHPEVKHTSGGGTIFENFLFNICKIQKNYDVGDYAQKAIKSLQDEIGDDRVLLALSGGVDSSVCAALIEKALPDRLTCVFVDHGLMRKNEGDEIERVFGNKKLNFIRVNAEERFIAALKGVTDPEQKRRIIGAQFIKEFETISNKLGHIPYFAQGTIYPDVIESGGTFSATIKSHHNVGGLPKSIGFEEVIEPLRGLFKDEVRAIGRQLLLPEALVARQPFPGPGLAVRILGEVTPEKLYVLREADAIVREELDKLKVRPDQYFAVLPGIRTVGVAGDGRAYDYVIGVRAVNTADFMTCEYARIPHSVLAKISSRISNEVQNAGRVVYDISGKPPATVEWE